MKGRWATNNWWSRSLDFWQCMYVQALRDSNLSFQACSFYLSYMSLFTHTNLYSCVCYNNSHCQKCMRRWCVRTSPDTPSVADSMLRKCVANWCSKHEVHVQVFVYNNGCLATQTLCSRSSFRVQRQVLHLLQGAFRYTPKSAKHLTQLSFSRNITTQYHTCQVWWAN